MITAVIVDWAGTVIDHGSRAPVATLQDIFQGAGVPITVAEARLSMGLAKRDHIRELLDVPRVAKEWEKVHGAPPNDADVGRLYAAFLPRQTELLPEYSDLIAGVPDAVDRMRARRYKIGSTTGYTRPMLDYLLERARGQGFSPDSAVCPGDVPGGGRPAPWMCYRNAIELQVSPLWTMVKIGDTPGDIEEGHNSGMWTIGITRTGNEAGLTEREWDGADETQRAGIVSAAAERLRGARSHFLAESVADCLPILEEIEGRLQAGERPHGPARV